MSWAKIVYKNELRQKYVTSVSLKLLTERHSCRSVLSRKESLFSVRFSPIDQSMTESTSVL